MRLLPIALLAALVSQGAHAQDAPVPLKPGEGDEVVTANCNVCHTSDYIVMNSTFLTPNAWQAEVMKMRTAFGAPIEDATAAEIIAYLAANYAVAGKP